MCAPTKPPAPDPPPPVPPPEPAVPLFPVVIAEPVPLEPDAPAPPAAGTSGFDTPPNVPVAKRIAVAVVDPPELPPPL